MSQQLANIRRLSGPTIASVSVAAPAEPRGEKKNFFVLILGGEKLLNVLLKSAGEIFLSGLRGAKFFFKHVSDRFSDLISRFSNRFSYRFKSFSGQFRSADVPP